MYPMVTLLNTKERIIVEWSVGLSLGGHLQSLGRNLSL